MSQTIDQPDAAPLRQPTAQVGFDPRLRTQFGPAHRIRSHLASFAPADVLHAAAVVPAVLVAAWLLVAFPMLLAGWFHPLYALLFSTVPAVYMLPPALRAGHAVLAAPRWTAITVVLTATACGVFAGVTHAEHLVIQRDAGSYGQIGYYLAHHSRLPISTGASAFGTGRNLVSFDSAAFFSKGDSLVPQFMSGWPMLLALAYQIGGWTGLFTLSAVVGACVVLAMGGLTARLIGPHWAPLASLAMAVTWPFLHVFQAPYSEPVALLLLLGGVYLLIDIFSKLADNGPAAEVITAGNRITQRAFTAGLLFGIVQVIRIDAGVEVALLLPVIAWWWASRRPGAVAFLAGLVLGGTLGAVDMGVVTGPYVHATISPVIEMSIALVGSTVASAILAWAIRRRGWAAQAPTWWRPMPAVAAALVVLAGAAIFARPYLYTDRSVTDPAVIGHTQSLQAADGLAPDGTRGYGEQSLRWLSWYVGWPLLVLALIGAAWLLYRALHGKEPGWLPALPVFIGSSILVLVQPGITPDHPWADRRFVVVAFPAVILFGVWTVASVVRFAAPRLPGRIHLGLRTAVIAACTVPALIAACPVAAQRTEHGEKKMTYTFCGKLQPDDVVVSLDPSSNWLPIVRGQCSNPAGYLDDPTPQNVAAVIAAIRATGHSPVVIASTAEALTKVGLTGDHVVRLNTRQDAQELTTAPRTTAPLQLNQWLARP